MVGWQKLIRLSALVMFPLLLGQSCATTPSDGTSGTNGETGATGPAGPKGDKGDTGPQGPAGTAGADGQLRIYGDGSAGDLVVNTSVVLETLVPGGNYMFRNVTVNAGVTLSIFSGATIRCLETFTNNGTISIQTGLQGGDARAAAMAGVGGSVAENSASSTGLVSDGGAGLTPGQAAGVLFVAPWIGGGGGGGGTEGRGGSGGGSFRVLARTSIVNAGTIRANGNSNFAHAGGGGAGGIIILASPGSITNSGTLSAKGGNGINGSVNFLTGAGGGGGGGIIHLLSPTITDTGTENVDGGPGGNNNTSVAGANGESGAGGGGCAGAGGFGSVVRIGEIIGPGQAGAFGGNFKTQVDPTPLF